MEEADEYETLPHGSTLSHYMIAGACAGLMEHVLVYPVDPIKTRMQLIQTSTQQIGQNSVASPYRSLLQATRHVAQNEGGSRSLLRGIGAVLFAAGPAHALYFPAYEFTKRAVQSFSAAGSACGGAGGACGGAGGAGGGAGSALAYPLAGLVGTLLHDAIMVPADAVKQRVQLHQSPYRNSWHCFTSVLLRNTGGVWAGVRTLYRAYPTQLCMTGPFHVIHVTCYELIQDAFNPHPTHTTTPSTDSDDQMKPMTQQTRPYRPGIHVIAGAISGATAAFLTNPLDVIKTFMNTRDQAKLMPETKWGLRNAADVTGVVRGGGGGGGGLLASVRFIAQQGGGWRAFMRGATARVVYAVPGTAISWSVYEFFKNALRLHSDAIATATAS